MADQQTINLDAERVEYARRRRMDEGLVDCLCNTILELQGRLAAVEKELIRLNNGEPALVPPRGDGSTRRRKP